MALINCPECNKQISDQAKTCPHCGYSVPKPTVYITCPECEEKIEKGMRNCSNCGYPVKFTAFIPEGKMEKLKKRIPLMIVGVFLALVLLSVSRIALHSFSFYINANHLLSISSRDDIDVDGTIGGSRGLKFTLRNYGDEEKVVDWIITKNGKFYGVDRCYVKSKQELQLISDKLDFGMYDKSEGKYKFYFFEGNKRLRTFITDIEKVDGEKAYVGLSYSQDK